MVVKPLVERRLIAMWQHAILTAGRTVREARRHELDPLDYLQRFQRQPAFRAQELRSLRRSNYTTCPTTKLLTRFRTGQIKHRRKAFRIYVHLGLCPLCTMDEIAPYLEMEQHVRRMGSAQFGTDNYFAQLDGHLLAMLMRCWEPIPIPLPLHPIILEIQAQAEP